MWFFISLLITLFLVYILAPKPKIVVKEVNLSNHQDLVFSKSDESCYKYKKEEVKCNFS